MQQQEYKTDTLKRISDITKKYKEIKGNKQNRNYVIETLAIIKDAQHLLGHNGENWIQGFLALDANDNPTKPYFNNAKKFSILGAMESSYGGKYQGLSSEKKSKYNYHWYSLSMGIENINGVVVKDKFLLMNGRKFDKIVDFNDHLLTKWEDIKMSLHMAKFLTLYNAYVPFHAIHDFP